MSAASRSTWLVAGAAALLAGVQLLGRPDPERRGHELFAEMAHSVAAETYARAAGLPGGLVQQPLVAGVVVRGRQLFPYGDGPAEAERAGRELVNPFRADDAAARARGAERYAAFCATCHGADGQGRGPATLKGVLPPPSFLADRARQLPDGALFHILARGQGNMSSYTAQLAPDDRWKVILHLRALQSPGGGG